MFRNILETIQGIEVFPMISLLLFTVVFASVLIWVFNMDKTRLQHMENMPLNDDISGEN